MFGIEIPTIITDACKAAGNRGYLYNNQGKLAFSATAVDKTVAIIQTNVTDMVVADDIRAEMNEKNYVYTAIGADNPNNSKSFLPDRYLERIGYEDRVYIYGVTDCFTLIRDYFRNNYNVFLPSNIDRSFGWWYMGRDLYLDNFSDYGFFETRDFIKKDDVLLFRFESGATSHSAIYMGDGMMLHHMLGRFSCIEPYDGAYKMNLVGVLRYGQ
jgi:cell wall-associated NlpC family hydrolase